MYLKALCLHYSQLLTRRFSLHATFLRNRIIGALRASEDSRAKEAATHISPNFVFENNTLHAIAKTLATLVEQGAGPSGQASSEEAIKAMIAKYSANLPQRASSQRKTLSEVVVLLTGSTGNLGSYALVALLREPNVRKVYTLNRPSADPIQRQKDAFRERGLAIDVLDNPKLTHLSGDVSKADLGLTDIVFAEVLPVHSGVKHSTDQNSLQIKESVTHVIHNAWRVDFNHPLASFEKNVAGSRQLVDFCAASAQGAKILFTSSIASAHKWDITKGPVPDEVLPDPSLATSSGYAASKFVVEVVRI